MKHQGMPPHLKNWIEARQRHHLSHAHVQMARELGMNPKKLGKLDNHKQEGRQAGGEAPPPGRSRPGPLRAAQGGLR